MVSDPGDWYTLATPIRTSSSTDIKVTTSIERSSASLLHSRSRKRFSNSNRLRLMSTPVSCSIRAATEMVSMTTS